MVPSLCWRDVLVISLFYFVIIVIWIWTHIFILCLFCVTVDLWPTKGSGRSYNSNCCYVRLVGGHTKKVMTSVIYCRVCQTCAVAKQKKKTKKHACVKNYEGSPKGMESAAILQIAPLDHLQIWKRALPKTKPPSIQHTDERGSKSKPSSSHT